MRASPTSKRNLVLIGCLLFTSCAVAPTTYRYDGKEYDSREAVLQAMQEDLNEDLNNTIDEIVPTGNPVGGRALVVVPNIGRINSHLASIPELSDEIDQAFTARSLLLTLEAETEMIRRRRIFDKVDSESSFYPESVIKAYDATLYVLLESRPYQKDKFVIQQTWFIRSGLTNESFPVEIEADKSPQAAPRKDFRQALAALLKERSFSWLNALEELARQHIEVRKPEKVRQSPIDLANKLREAEENYRLGNLDLAVDILESILESENIAFQDAIQAYELLCKTHLAKDNLQEAKKTLTMLLALSPDYQPDPAFEPPSFIKFVRDIKKARH